VVVQLYSGNAYLSSTNSNSTGGYLFTDVGYGNYTLVTGSNQEILALNTTSISITSEGVFRLDVVLRRPIGIWLTVGVQHDAEIYPPGDWDYYRFNASATTYSIETISEIDTYMYLFGLDGFTELDRDDDSGVSYNAKITWAFDEAGTYFVKVKGYSSSTTGDYSVVITDLGSIYDDDAPSGATWLDHDTPYAAEIWPGGDRDYYRFNASVANYTVWTNGSIDTIMYLYDTDGETQIGFNDDGGTGSNALITWECTSPGTYFIRVQGYSSSSTGAYNVTFVSDAPAAMAEYTLELGAGWNMVSLPVIPEDPSAASVLAGAGFYQLVTWSGSGYVVATSFEAGVGYWLLVLTDMDIIISGQPVAVVTLDLSPGWNMVGGPNTVVLASEVFPGFYQLVTWSGSSYVSSANFAPGSGYWALVLQEIQLQLPPA